MTNEFKTARIEIVVPTYNRSECIADMMRKYAAYFEQRYDFSVSVWDSSTNDETENIMNGYLSDRVRYVRKPSDMDVDEKTMVALHNALGDYVYLCGDGYTVRIDKVADVLNNIQDAEIVVMYNKEWFINRKGTADILKKTSYYDKNEFFADHYWQLIFYGGSVCKRELINKFDDEKLISDFNGSGFIFPSALAIYSDGPFLSCVDDFLLSNTGKKEAGWVTNKNAMIQWTEKYCVTAEKLRDCLSNAAVNDIIKTIGLRSGFFTFKGLMRFRESDNFNLKLLKRYKRYFAQVKACSMFTAYMVAMTPGWICRAAHKLYRIIKRSDRKEKDR